MPWRSWWMSSKGEEHDNEPSLSTKIRHMVDENVKVSKDYSHGTEAHSAVPTTSFWTTLLQPHTVLATAALTTILLGTLRFYRTFLRRIPLATSIDQSYLRKRSVFGKVVSVGDGDNFRIYHTPGGWLAGWGWLPWRRVPTHRKALKNNTIHVRIAGVDAPEMSHFGRPAQPFSKEALEWLTSYLRGRRVRAYVYKIDQYSRVVATAYVWKGLLRRDVGLQMIRAGLATVYEAKTGAEFGEGLEQKYHRAERRARAKKKGMWSGNMREFESPRQYKTRYREQEIPSN